MSWLFAYCIKLKCWDCSRQEDVFLERTPHSEGIVGCKKCQESVKVYYPAWKTISKTEGCISLTVIPLP